MACQSTVVTAQSARLQSIGLRSGFGYRARVANQRQQHSRAQHNPLPCSWLGSVQVYQDSSSLRSSSGQGPKPRGGWMVSGKGAEAKFCVSTDKGRKQAERWGQHVTPGPQAWAAAAVMARIMALFVLPVNSPEKKGFQGLLLLFAHRWLPEAPL